VLPRTTHCTYDDWNEWSTDGWRWNAIRLSTVGNWAFTVVDLCGSGITRRGDDVSLVTADNLLSASQKPGSSESHIQTSSSEPSSVRLAISFFNC